MKSAALAEHRTALAPRGRSRGHRARRAARVQRLAAVTAELTAWREQAEGARQRIGRGQRLADTRTERAGLDEAPAVFAAQRQAC
jgi:hypothetical protein